MVCLTFQVFVDSNGQLQFGDRLPFFRTFDPICNSSQVEHDDFSS